MKKLLAVLLTLCLMLSVAAIADTSLLNTDAAYPVVTEPLTLTLVGPRDASQGEWKDLKFFQKWQEITGVTLDITTYAEDGWDVNLNLIMSEDKMPDIIYAGGITAAQEVDWGDDQKALLPLEDLIEEYMPNLSAILEANPVIKSSITTPEGHIYCLPWINDMPRDLVYGKYWINNAWLKKLDIAEPTTVEELYAALTAFKEKDANGNGDPDDEIPYSGNKTIKNFYRTVAWWGKAVDDNTLMGTTEDGEVYYAPLTEEWKKMVTFWANAWEDGLVDSQLFEMDGAALKAKGQAAGDQTIGMFQQAGAFLVVPSEQNEDYTIVACLVENEGDTPVWAKTTGLSRGALAITASCEHPEVVCRMADWVYEWKEYGGGIYNMRGEAGVDFYYVDENGEQTEQARIDRKFLVLEYTGYDSFEVKRAKVLTANSGSTTPGIGGGTMPQVIYPLNDWINAEVERQYVPYWRVIYPDVYMSKADTDRAAELKVQLDYAIETWTADFITGAKSLDADYDTFIAEIQALGEEYLDIYTRAYGK
ncbi:MAG: extracellular solute-binding protein [Clostridiales bacterium]|nr:extracellular solute-binding protein [Clostridiales bacterium]